MYFSATAAERAYYPVFREEKRGKENGYIGSSQNRRVGRML